MLNSIKMWSKEFLHRLPLAHTQRSLPNALTVASLHSSNRFISDGDWFCIFCPSRWSQGSKSLLDVDTSLQKRGRAWLVNWPSDIPRLRFPSENSGSIIFITEIRIWADTSIVRGRLTGPGTFRNCVFIFSHETALALKAKAEVANMERRLRQGSSASEETSKTENSFSQLTRFLSSTCVLRSFATAFFNFGYYKNALRITQESGLRNENKKRVGKRRENPRAMNCILMIEQLLEARLRRKSFIEGCLIEAEWIGLLPWSKTVEHDSTSLGRIFQEGWCQQLNTRC